MSSSCLIFPLSPAVVSESGCILCCIRISGTYTNLPFIFAIVSQAYQSKFIENSFENRNPGRLCMLYITAGHEIELPSDKERFFQNLLLMFFLKGMNRDSVNRLILRSRLLALSF